LYTAQRAIGSSIAVILSDEIYRVLAHSIVTGALEPGRRLDEPSLCRQFEVSRTPVREALRRLSGTGLVEMLPRRGVTVARIEIEQLTEMYEALSEFEGLCARLSATRMTPLEKKRLEILNNGQKERIKGSDADRLKLNNEFHELIYRGSHSPSIATVTRNFRQRLAPFSVLRFVPGSAEYSLGDHDEIVRAIMTSEVEHAYATMRDHITNAGLQVIELFSRRETSLQTATLDATRRKPPTRAAAGARRSKRPR
jgi:DNA-binding GntR family transcriptional regulator